MEVPVDGGYPELAHIYIINYGVVRTRLQSLKPQNRPASSPEGRRGGLKSRGVVRTSAEFTPSLW